MTENYSFNWKLSYLKIPTQTIVLFLSQNRSIVLFWLMGCVTFINSYSQDVYVASGSTISGNGGSASYSIGQVIQTTEVGPIGSVIQGIQFYFPDATLTIIDMDTSLNIVTYPNPTTSIINLEVQNAPESVFFYRLFDMAGSFVLSGETIDQIATIEINHLAVGVYLLQVTDGKSSPKLFKIIKN